MKKILDHKFAFVPASYLLWIARQDWCPKDVSDYVQENKEVLESEIKQK